MLTKAGRPFSFSLVLLPFAFLVRHSFIRLLSAEADWRTWRRRITFALELYFPLPQIENRKSLFPAFYPPCCVADLSASGGLAEWRTGGLVWFPAPFSFVLSIQVLNLEFVSCFVLRTCPPQADFLLQSSIDNRNSSIPIPPLAAGGWKLEANWHCTILLFLEISKIFNCFWQKRLHLFIPQKPPLFRQIYASPLHIRSVL